MRFLPTVDLWGPLEEAVRSGQLRLQPGQWVKCGSERPSRFVGIRPGGTIWAVHPHGDEGVSHVRFKQLLAARPRPR